MPGRCPIERPTERDGNHSAAVRKWRRYFSCGLLLALVACQSDPPAPLLSPSRSQPPISPYAPRGESQSIPLVIYPIKNVGSASSATWVGSTLTELLISDLARWPHLKVIPRQALPSILREQWVQYHYSPTDAVVGVGKLQGARVFIRGGFSEYQEALTIDLQIIDIETGVLLDAIRVDGTLKELPQLEESLVRHLVERLPGAVEKLRHIHDDAGPRKDAEYVEEEKFGNTHSLEPASGTLLQSVFAETIWLSQEAATQRRLRVLQAAQKFFEHGLTIEIGQPHAGILDMPNDLQDSFVIVQVPMSVFVEPARLKEWGMRNGFHELVAWILNQPEDRMDTGQGHDEERQWFGELLSRPRRVFVRARSGEGDILAVSSQMMWRTDRTIQVDANEDLGLPIWPQPLVTGVAEFPVSWLGAQESGLNFDAVVVDVNEQEVHVRVELIEPEAGTQWSEDLRTTEKNIRQVLEQKIRASWNPSVAQALPGPAYLPQNKEEIHIQLSVDNGAIRRLNFQTTSRDPLFSRSMLELRKDLLGLCLSCEADLVMPAELEILDYRVQCSLVKPIRQTGLGSRIP